MGGGGEKEERVDSRHQLLGLLTPPLPRQVLGNTNEMGTGFSQWTLQHGGLDD